MTLCVFHFDPQLSKIELIVLKGSLERLCVIHLIL